MEKKVKNREGGLTLIEKIIALLFSLIIITMFTQVIFRYLFNQSLYWSEEIVRYIFVWLVFLGGALVTRDREHIGIDFLLSKFPSRFSKSLTYINLSIIILVNFFFTIAGIILVFKLKGSFSPALGLPVNWFLYAALPLSSLLSGYYGYQNIRKIKKTTNYLSEEAGSL